MNFFKNYDKLGRKINSFINYVETNWESPKCYMLTKNVNYI